MSSAFSPFQLGPIRLRNRVVKSATFEGMTRGGLPTDELVEFHRRLAAGGVALTTVAYGAVSPDARSFDTQMWLSPDALPGLRRLTDAVHAEGGAASIQLTHCGGFSKSARARALGGPLGPSFGLNAFGVAHGIPFTRAMSEADIERVVDDFGRAAALAIEAGFDALEVHLGHGYLLSQFLSPKTNRRRDRWGGSVERRLALPLRVVERVLTVARGRVAVLAKTNLSDGFAGGLELPEAITIARALERAGVDAIEPSGGFTSRTPFFLLRGERPLQQMIEVDSSALQRLVLRTVGRVIIEAHPFEELFFLPMARELRAAVKVPLVLLGGAMSLENLETGIEEGFELVAMGRALIADPDLVNRMMRGEATRSRCNHCNQCVAEMDRGGVRCVL